MIEKLSLKLPQLATWTAPAWPCSKLTRNSKSSTNLKVKKIISLADNDPLIEDDNDGKFWVGLVNKELRDCGGNKKRAANCLGWIDGSDFDINNHAPNLQVIN